MAAPSPMTNPSRPASKGRLAPGGSSLRVRQRPRLAEAGDGELAHGASPPPATMTSAAPRLMISAASPMALADAAHAVTTQVFGPNRLYRIDTSPPPCSR